MALHHHLVVTLVTCSFPPRLLPDSQRGSARPFPRTGNTGGKRKDASQTRPSVSGTDGDRGPTRGPPRSRQGALATECDGTSRDTNRAWATWGTSVAEGGPPSTRTLSEAKSKGGRTFVPWAVQPVQEMREVTLPANPSTAANPASQSKSSG